MSEESLDPEMLASLLHGGSGLAIGFGSADVDDDDDDDGEESGIRIISLGDMLRAASAAEESEESDSTNPASRLSPENRAKLSDLISGLSAKIMAMDAAFQIQKYVTPQVASELLWCYGDFDGTTEPSMATAALINLIRVAHISDEDILMHLNDIGHFHGYVLGICLMAERGETGMAHLRSLASLDGPVKKD